MNWSENMIARAVARQTLERKCLVVVPNCGWTGYECDLLAVTRDLRIIDVEVKISRADLKVDARKYKWWESYTRDPVTGANEYHEPPLPRTHPFKVWKHYYCLPKDIWKPDLVDYLPSPASGVLLMYEHKEGGLKIECWRRSTPSRDAERLSAANAVDLARLASLRMWDAYDALERPAA